MSKVGIELFSKSTEETFEIGRALGQTARKGDIIALTGELGTGKTCLTQGIAKGLDVPPVYSVTSPTFTLINEYPGRLRLYHFDVYRLSGAPDIEEMGYEDYFYGSGVAVIEWAEKISELLPQESIVVELAHINENTRKILLTGPAKRLESFKHELKGDIQ